ncbi:uncharacterized protein At4g08330, chloroplastic-like [Rhodamnia argentea]|uniref:Uncharacterized protein At4g08330, chloroplastic-like n=1 Tax=Rhodamnia argentea TaxID=178133 RepID=A0A8B8QDK6_9MYRT|nr:uncharacterized protein At4g08330, chloroplastic-like [Rhodamnia argentea]
MANSMFLEDGPRGSTRSPFLRSASVKDVSYSCGSCGYELYLSSLNRNMSTIGTKYRKSIKKGIISFCNIDESRFTLVDELQCIPYFSKQSWGWFRRRTRLLCRKCGNRIGIAYDPTTSSDPLVSDGLESCSSSEVPSQRKYDIRIRALQPSSSEGSSMSVFV